MRKIMKKIEDSEVSHRTIGVNQVLGVNIEDKTEKEIISEIDHSQ